MSALTADFDSYIKNERAHNKFSVDAGDAIFVGSLCQMDGAAAYVEAAASGTSRRIVGQATKSVLAAKTTDTDIDVREGDIFLHLSEDGADKPVTTDIGAQVYAVSDHEISMRSATNGVAGILLAIENGGALVRCTLEASN